MPFLLGCLHIFNKPGGLSGETRKDGRAYAEVPAHRGEKVDDIHVLVPVLVIHHPHGCQPPAIWWPEVFLVIAKHSLHVLDHRGEFLIKPKRIPVPK